MRLTGKGFLSRAPEFLYTDKGVAIWKTSLVVRGRGEADEPLLLELLAFNEMAEAIAEMEPQKGALVYLEGRLNVESYLSREGEKRSRLVVILGHGPSPYLGEFGIRFGAPTPNEPRPPQEEHGGLGLPDRGAYRPHGEG